MSVQRVLHRLEIGFLVLLVACLLALTCGQILMRNLFSITFLGSESLVRHLVLWIGLVGALVATRLDKHIRIDAALRLLPARVRAMVLGCADCFAAALCAYLAYIAGGFVLDERAFGTTAFFAVPAWIAQLCFPLVFGLMGLRFLLQGGRRLRAPAAGP